MGTSIKHARLLSACRTKRLKNARIFHFVLLDIFCRTEGASRIIVASSFRRAM